jgi:hypothetical protein
MFGRSSGLNPGSGTRGLGIVLLGNLSTGGRGGLELSFVLFVFEGFEKRVSILEPVSSQTGKSTVLDSIQHLSHINLASDFDL